MTSQEIQKETNINTLLDRLTSPDKTNKVNKKERRLLRRRITRLEKSSPQEG